MTTTEITPVQAAASLDATALDIDTMPMTDRRTFLRELRRLHAGPYGAADRWRNLEGVVTFFAEAGLGRPGTWISVVNAGVLESLARGFALAADHTADDFGNPAAAAWSRYLHRLADGELTEPSDHATAWSQAKKISTDYGVRLAAHRGLTPTPVELRFLRIAELYNYCMAHRAPLDAVVAFRGLLHPGLASIDPAKIDQLFDVGDADTAQRGCEIAYAAALLDQTPHSLVLLRQFVPLLRTLFRAAA